MVFGRIYASHADRCSCDNAQLRQSGCRQGDQAVAGHRSTPFKPNEDCSAAIQRCHLDITGKRQDAMRPGYARRAGGVFGHIADLIVIHRVDRRVGNAVDHIRLANYHRVICCRTGPDRRGGIVRLDLGIARANGWRERGQCSDYGKRSLNWRFHQRAAPHSSRNSSSNYTRG